MEFTRGPKCFPKYFIIEIVPRWVIKLEGTFIVRGACGVCINPYTRGHSSTRTYTVYAREPANHHDGHQITAPKLKYWPSMSL